MKEFLVTHVAAPFVLAVAVLALAVAASEYTAYATARDRAAVDAIFSPGAPADEFPANYQEGALHTANAVCPDGVELDVWVRGDYGQAVVVTVGDERFTRFINTNEARYFIGASEAPHVFAWVLALEARSDLAAEVAFAPDNAEHAGCTWQTVIQHPTPAQ